MGVGLLPSQKLPVWVGTLPLPQLSTWGQEGRAQPVCSWARVWGAGKAHCCLPRNSPRTPPPLCVMASLAVACTWPPGCPGPLGCPSSPQLVLFTHPSWPVSGPQLAPPPLGVWVWGEGQATIQPGARTPLCPGLCPQLSLWNNLFVLSHLPDPLSGLLVAVALGAMVAVFQ